MTTACCVLFYHSGASSISVRSFINFISRSSNSKPMHLFLTVKSIRALYLHKEINLSCSAQIGWLEGLEIINFLFRRCDLSCTEPTCVSLPVSGLVSGCWLGLGLWAELSLWTTTMLTPRFPAVSTIRQELTTLLTFTQMNKHCSGAGGHVQ